MKINLSELKTVPQEKWDVLANKKIYFGHQSVGYNIIDGMKDVMAEMPAIKLNIVETKNPQEMDKPGFYHSRVGQNRDPYSKIDDFKRIMDSGVADKVDIAFFKFCYVDIVENTDVNKVFEYYVNIIDELSKKYPKVKFVHSMVPLTTLQGGLKAGIKKMLGKQLDGVEDNIKRNLFNQLLVERYEGKVFCLSTFESTKLDGSAQTFIIGRKQYRSLITNYSDDGGHLNAMGKLLVGKGLLVFLANN